MRPQDSDGSASQQASPVATVAEAGRAYVRRGFAVVRVPLRKKNPVIKGWPESRLGEADIDRHFRGRSNIGVLNGEPSGGLVDVDLDAAEAVALADAFLPTTTLVFGRASKPRSHRIYRVVGPLPPTRQFKDVNGTMLAELRSTGTQTLWPGSVHPSGETIEFAADGEPAELSADALAAAVRNVAACAFLARHWPTQRGSRHAVANAIAGVLLRRDLSASDVVKIIETAARVSGDEEWRARAGAARSTAAALCAGRKVTGAPTLGSLIGEQASRRLCDFLAVGSGATMAENGTGGADAAHATRTPLTGGQSFVDGSLVYALRYGSEMVCVTSGREVLDARAVNARYELTPPTLDARLTRGALERFRAGEPTPQGRRLFDNLVALLQRHVVWPSEHTPGLVALWIMATYLFRIFPFFPYLALNSMTKRSGKSRVLEIIGELAWNPTGIMVNPTIAALYRDIHVNAPTVLLDEVEGLGGRDREAYRDVIAVLNAGFKHDGTVPRNERHNGGFVLVRFRAFSPKVLASIRRLPDTIRDRALVVVLQRKRPDERVERFSVRQQHADLADLRDRLHLWALGHAADVAKLYEAADSFRVPEGLDDRARDIIEPLFAVAGALDAEAGEDAVTMALVASTKELASSRGHDLGDDETVVVAIQKLLAWFKTYAKATDLVLTTQEALFVFGSSDDLPWVTEPKHARSLLRRLGFISATHRRQGVVVRGYRITRRDIDDRAARYGLREAIEEESAP